MALSEDSIPPRESNCAQPVDEGRGDNNIEFPSILVPRETVKLDIEGQRSAIAGDRFIILQKKRPPIEIQFKIRGTIQYQVSTNQPYARLSKESYP
jgi:hypothetical protein